MAQKCDHLNYIISFRINGYVFVLSEAFECVYLPLCVLFLNFESCVWRTVSSQSSHHPQEVLLAQFSLYLPKGGLKPDSFYFISYIAGISEWGKNNGHCQSPDPHFIFRFMFPH